MNIDLLKENLLNNNFEEAEGIVKRLSVDEINSVIMNLAHDTENILIYTFIVSLLLQEETAELHSLLSSLFITAFCYFEGAYSTALYHARKTLELDPDNIENKQYLLFFHDIPDRLISKEEAMKIAMEVLEVNPMSKVALDIIERKL